MPDIFFTADTHFRHKNILKYCNRPFTSIGEMDERLIEHWNSVVNPGDQVYHLGDFAMTRDRRSVEFLLQELNGEVHLIRGSHDKDAVTKARGFASVNDMLTLRGPEFPEPITLCHYAMLRWPHAHHGSWHLFGHSHGKTRGIGQSFDVGVDCWDYTPISLEQVCSVLGCMRAEGRADG